VTGTLSPGIKRAGREADHSSLSIAEVKKVKPCKFYIYKYIYIYMALSRKPFGIGNMYIYTFLLRMTDSVTYQNIDRSLWDILYICI
jgi:hypothetical protein